jgi:N-methylhydantoinase A
MSYAVMVATVPDEAPPPLTNGEARAAAKRTQWVRDTVTGEVSEWTVVDRAALRPGEKLHGPAIIAEDETSTLVGRGWSATKNTFGYIELLREVR